MLLLLSLGYDPQTIFPPLMVAKTQRLSSSIGLTRKGSMLRIAKSLFQPQQSPSCLPHVVARQNQQRQSLRQTSRRDQGVQHSSRLFAKYLPPKESQIGVAAKAKKPSSQAGMMLSLRHRRPLISKESSHKE